MFRVKFTGPGEVNGKTYAKGDGPVRVSRSIRDRLVEDEKCAVDYVEPPKPRKRKLEEE